MLTAEYKPTNLAVELGLVESLTYISYRHNRLNGCSARLADLFEDGEELEREYQRERRERNG